MKVLKLIFIFSGILTLVLFILCYCLYHLTSNSLPKYQQDLNSSQIKDDIKISRDSYAIPYIDAKNDLDSFFALGYAHAQDRLWQMVLLRRIAQGRLSEIIGVDGLENDKLMRTVAIYSSAQNSEKKQSKDTMNLLKSYSNGINFYIKQISENSWGRGGPEFFLFTPQISPWRPADSIALLKLIAFQSTNKASVEILRTQLLLAQIKPDRYADIFEEPPLISDSTTQSISYLKTQNFNETKMPAKDRRRNTDLYFGNNLSLDGNLTASNLFAVMPFRSATGQVLAASDPHSTLTSPSNFMLINIKLSNGTITGGSIPGIPAIIVGRSKYFGWGVANAQIDDQDLYIEKLNPNNNLEYYTEKGLVKFKNKNEIIKIKNKKSITFKIKSTRNGPVLASNLLGVDAIRPKGHEVSIKWTGLSDDDQSVHSLISIMRSRNLNEAKKNLSLMQSPGQNVMLVDNKNIEIRTVGSIPKRRVNHSTKGKIPALGWQEKDSWLGNIALEKLPRIINPKSGIIINTNNKTTDAPFPFHLSYDWGDSQRIIRATNLLKKRQFHTVSSFQEIQNDTVSISAKILIPLLAKSLWFEQQVDKNTQWEEAEEQALSLLSAWNGDMNQNNAEPLIFVSWLREFQRMIMIDDVGDLYKKMSNIRPLFLERVLRDKNGASQWCDIMQTPPKETCDQIAKRALTVSLKKLQTQFGSTISDWRWGEPHIAIHKSKIIGSWPVLSFFTNIVHEVSGGDNTMNMSRMAEGQINQFVAKYGSTLKSIFDFSNDDHSLFIISTGQSGHFLSPHYDDQSLLWQQEQYIPIKFNILDREGGSTATTTFKPIIPTAN